MIRRVVTRMLEATGEITVIDTAADGREAVKKICALRPDVVSLDLEMPVLDGLGVLRQVMQKCPVPVVMLSAHTTEGARATMQALSLGAVDFVAKPARAGQLDIMVAELILKLKAAARISRNKLIRLPRTSAAGSPSATTGPKSGTLPVSRTNAPAATANQAEIVVIGASTGGPAALQTIIPALPANLPAAVVIVQHLPAGFSRSLAEHLERRSRLSVKHAEAGQPILPGQVLVAPAGCKFIFHGRPGSVSVQLESAKNKRQPGAFYPSVDVVMSSAAEIYSKRAMGVLLTGMGKDGARGMAAIYQQGGFTIAEDENTCVVFGMPRAAIEDGVARKVLPMENIAEEIVKHSM